MKSSPPVPQGFPDRLVVDAAVQVESVVLADQRGLLHGTGIWARGTGWYRRPGAPSSAWLATHRHERGLAREVGAIPERRRPDREQPEKKRRAREPEDSQGAAKPTPAHLMTLTVVVLEVLTGMAAGANEPLIVASPVLVDFPPR